ncbi:MAG: glycoside hydrolase family 3 [Chloroflexi bacterium]|nr:MAG: glycoside hydrolase family 3 [Chloroflexota bacterium]
MHPVFSNHLSRRAVFKIAGQGVLGTALVAGCRPPATQPPASDPVVPTALPAPSPTLLPTTAPASATPTVSLATKIGQMLMVGFRGLTVDSQHPIVRDIQVRNLGSVVLFDYDVLSARYERNIASPQQVKELVASLQSFARDPLLVAIDQEGGIISRLHERYGFPPTLSHQTLGERNDPAATRQHAGEMAHTLAGLGINLNLAPVVDLNTNPANPIIAAYERSFGADPQRVAAHAQAFIEAHHAAGVLCTLKHFPGHGSSTADSHQGFVDVTETWSRQEVIPYQSLIEAGLADAVMTAHVFNAQLDPEYPATLSHPTITGLLRKELGYDGVVISDDMQMEAIRSHYGFETAVHKTLEAGVDLIAIGNNLVYEEDIVARTVSVVTQLVENGAISEARIDASYRRVQRLKGSPVLNRNIDSAQ